MEFLRRLRGAIESLCGTETPERALLLIAFCRTLISLSNAAFNHQSMSFKSEAQASLGFDRDMGGMFEEDVRFVLHGAAADQPHRIKYRKLTR